MKEVSRRLLTHNCYPEHTFPPSSSGRALAVLLSVDRSLANLALNLRPHHVFTFEFLFPKLERLVILDLSTNADFLRDFFTNEEELQNMQHGLQLHITLPSPVRQPQPSSQPMPYQLLSDILAPRLNRVLIPRYGCHTQRNTTLPLITHHCSLLGSRCPIFPQKKIPTACSSDMRVGRKPSPISPPSRHSRTSPTAISDLYVFSIPLIAQLRPMDFDYPI